MNRRLIETVGMMLVVCLAGCATTTKETSPAASSEEQQVTSVLQRINDATALAANAQRELAMTADAKVAKEAAMRQRLLTDAVNYDFYGDVEDILRDIATKYAYDFEVYGKRPPERVNVSVFVSKKPVIEVLKQIGYQSGWLDVKLTKSAIELYYKPRPER